MANPERALSRRRECAAIEDAQAGELRRRDEESRTPESPTKPVPGAVVGH
jgi:hypothetical protein